MEHQRGRIFREDILPPVQATRLDTLIATVAPEWAASRLRARGRIQMMTRNYEGGKIGRRTDNWTTPGTDANEASRSTLFRLRNRSRDLARNNIWAGRGIRVMSRSVVGPGILCRLTDAEGRPITSTDAADIRGAWMRWAMTPEIDADGKMNLYSLQRLVMRTLQQSGELLIRRRWRRVSDGLTVPLQLQVLEPDYLDRTRDGPGTSEVSGRPVRRINGIEFDELGRRTGYWLHREHPGSGWLRDIRSYFIPAEEIMHVHRVDRPGQVTGVPPLAPAIVRTRDLDEFEDAWLVRNKIASMFAGFIYDNVDIDALGATQRKNVDGTISDTFEPGMLETLPQGKDIKFSDPPSLAGYDEYTSGQLRAIAMSLDVTYEQLAGDLSGTNYSSARIGSISHWDAVDDWRNDVVVPQFLDQLFAWFMLAYDLAGKRIPTDIFPRWTPPKRTMIDPTVETAAAIRSVRGGLQSYSEALREQGYEPEEVLDELTQDMTNIRGRKLLLEVDPLADANRVQQKAGGDTTGNADNGGRKPPTAGKAAGGK